MVIGRLRHENVERELIDGKILNKGCFFSNLSYCNFLHIVNRFFSFSAL